MCSWHSKGHSELQDSSQEQFLFSNVPMTLMTEGKTLVGGEGAAPRRPHTGDFPMGVGHRVENGAYLEGL